MTQKNMSNMASKSISQQRIMGMAWAARTGRLDTSKLDGDLKDKVEKIAKSKNFSDKSLHKKAATKHRNPDDNKLLPYKIGKGTPEEPEFKRKPYKKRVVKENYIPSIKEFIIEQKFQDFYNGYIDAMALMEDSYIPNHSNLFETFKIIIENIQLNTGMNLTGMGPVELPGNPGTSSDFHNQSPGSGDVFIKNDEDEDEEDEEE